MKQMILVLTSLMLASAAFAGDASNFVKLGFSKDKKYFAFAQYGIGDGSGYGYAEVGIIDVAKNTYVSVVRDQDEDEQPNKQNNLSRAIQKSPLSKYGIQAGKNLGEDLLVRLPTDKSSYGEAVFSIYSAAEGGATLTPPRYSLQITEKDAKSVDYCNDQNKMIRLTLSSQPDETPLRVVLQDDVAQPKSRHCSYEYSVTRVTKLGDAFVVVLQFKSDGFEGPDYRSMVVTGNVQFP